MLVDTFYYLLLSHPYTEPLKCYSVQVSLPVSSLFVINGIAPIILSRDFNIEILTRV